MVVHRQFKIDFMTWGFVTIELFLNKLWDQYTILQGPKCYFIWYSEELSSFQDWQYIFQRNWKPI